MYGNEFEASPSLYVDGAWESPTEGRTFTVSNPADGATLAAVGDCDAQSIDRAISAADGAFRAWAANTAHERAGFLLRASLLLYDRIERVARILTQESGKPIRESRDEVESAARYLAWHAEEARRIYGRVVPPTATDRRILVLRQPVGVVAAITPWNFPLGMVVRKIAPALAAGCTVVLRPASKTPLVAIELFKVFDEVGLPPGVANLTVNADSRVFGNKIIADERIRKVTFTGSAAVGKLLLRDAAAQVKRVSLELGGTASFIVFADSDLDQAADYAVRTGFRNAGQTCICTNRLLVERPVAADFTRRVAERVSELKVGNGLDEAVDVGPVIDRAAVARVERHQADAIARGAHLVAGGSQAPGHSSRLFYKPTVIAGVSPQALVAREETFGPLLPIIEFADENEAVRMANDTVHGLAAYFQTRDIARAFRVAEALDYGIIGVNDPAPVGAHIPFGGMKQSGLGREAGSEGMDEFLETKAVSIGLSS